MSTPLEKAVQISLKAVRKVAGAPVTYSRDATTLTISQAVQGRTSKLNIDIGGAEQVVEAADWLIKVTDLSTLAPPEAGDIIVRTVEGVTYTWTVETLEMGEVEWDWSDTARTAYRIHTRKDGASAYEVSEPTGFDLSGAELKPAQTKIPALSGWTILGATFTQNGSSFDLTFDREQYKPTTSQDYYVSYPGFGTQDGSSWANAKSIIRFAVDAANTAGVAPRIFLDGGQTHENDASMAPSMQLIGVNRGSGATPTLSSPTFVTDASYATNLYCENLIFDTVVNSAAGTRMFKNCSFANSVAANTDAAQFSGSGIVILEDCTTANRPGDGFEYTGTVSAFEIGCTAVANGDGVTVADNGSTAHGDVRIVRYNGTYTDGYRNIHDVDDVKSYLIDCTVNTSQSLSGGVAYDSFNVGCGQTESTDTTEVTIWSGNVSGGAVVDLFNDSDGTLTVYNLATYSTSSGTITAAVVG